MCRAFRAGKIENGDITSPPADADVVCCTTRSRFRKGFFPVDTRLVKTNALAMRVLSHLCLVPNHPQTPVRLPNYVDTIDLPQPKPTVLITTAFKAPECLYIDLETDDLIFKVARVLGATEAEARALQGSFDGKQPVVPSTFNIRVAHQKEEIRSLPMSSRGNKRLDMDLNSESFGIWSSDEDMGRLRIAGVRAVVFDMDSTLVDGEGIDELARLHQCTERVEALTKRAMRGDMDFLEAFRERLQLLEGLPYRSMQALRMPLNQGVKETIAELKDRGSLVGLVSGGFLTLARFVVKDLALDFAVANQVQTDGSFLTGRSLGQVITSQHKRQVFIEVLRATGIPRPLIFAVGDGSNDIPMLT